MTGMMAASGCCRRYSSSSSLSIASGASGLSGLACIWAERRQDSWIRLLRPGSCRSAGNTSPRESSSSWPALAYCWRNAAGTPPAGGNSVAGWIGFLIELPPDGPDGVPEAAMCG